MSRYLIAAAVVVALAALLWIAGSFNYQSCVNAAEARTPTLLEAADPDELFGEASVTNERQRRAAVEGCSRLPW